MSYCRWSDGDVYMYEHVGGFIECCACKFAPLVKTIYTEGTLDLPKDDLGKKLFGDIPPCKYCHGKGCDKCMMHSNTHLHSYEEALEHLNKHVKSGDYVPSYAFEALKEDIASGLKVGEDET